MGVFFYFLVTYCVAWLAGYYTCVFNRKINEYTDGLEQQKTKVKDLYPPKDH